MAKRPIVLVHGYSAAGSGFGRWAEILQSFGYNASDIHTCTYRSLTNEVTIKDIAEGFNRALRVKVGLDKDEEFDAIVHSTGMLVVRAWLSTYSKRRDRLKHLIGLAPATFGSPLAHKGRSWLGALVKGNWEAGSDFLEAGDLILDGLELASRFTWDLTHLDMLGEETVYGPAGDTPYVFTFCGTRGFGEPFGLISKPGTDGTVRLAGCALNTRKIMLDLTTDEARLASKRRVDTAPWTHIDSPFVPIAGLHHGTIISEPSPELVELVRTALETSDEVSYKAWCEAAQAHTEAVLNQETDLGSWQQFVMRVVDERDDPISDYYVDFLTKRNGEVAWQPLKEVHPEFEMDIHPYSADKSFRCFHINLNTVILAEGDKLGVRLIASSGSQLVGYNGYTDTTVHIGLEEPNTQGEWNGIIDLSTLPEIKFFYPFTTTLVEIKLNREPLPLAGKNELLWFPD